MKIIGCNKFTLFKFEECLQYLKSIEIFFKDHLKKLDILTIVKFKFL